MNVDKTLNFLLCKYDIKKHRKVISQKTRNIFYIVNELCCHGRRDHLEEKLLMSIEKMSTDQLELIIRIAHNQKEG